MDTPQEPQPPQNKTHKVVKNDTLIGIARKYGHKDNDWTKIWNHPSNRSVASKRGKPELIQPGDIFIVPPSAKEMQEYEEAKRKIEEEFEKLTQEIAALKKKIQRQLLDNAYPLKSAADGVRNLWESLLRLKNDQYIVGWFLHNLPGTPDFPKDDLITKAEKSVADLIAAIKNEQFYVNYAALDAKLTNTMEAVRDAQIMMRDYQQDLQVGGGNVISVLEVTRDVSFVALGVMASIATAGTGMAAVASVQGGVAALKSFSDELSGGFAKGAAGTAWNVAVDGTVGAAVGLVLRDGSGSKKFIEKLAEKLAGKMALSYLSKELAAKWIEGVGSAIVDSAIGGLGDVLKGDTTSVDAFFTKLAIDIVTKCPVSFLEAWLDKEFVARSFKELQPNSNIFKIKDRVPLNQKEYATIIGKTVGGFIQKKIADALKDTISIAKTVEVIGKKVVELVVKDSAFKAHVRKQVELFEERENKKKK